MLNAFTPQQYAWLASGIVLLFVAVIFFLRGQTTFSLFILTVGGFALRLLMTSTDPFLYDWDEQYHALVAKHLIAHPGTPMLYDDPLLPVDISRWAENHIWLHKPPLFLWLIAISVKLFGTTPFAVKLPSVILSSLMIPALFGFMKRIANEKTAWLAALFMAAHSYSIQLVSGFRNTDHNDVIFSAFVLFSFWAWIKYTDEQRPRDAILTGVLVACAVLVKWLPGMLVFLPWGMWMLRKQNRKDKKRWIHFLIAIVCAALVVLPWYIHIFTNFPAEAAFEMKYNRLHFTIAIEGHDGPWYYHFEALRELLGWGLVIFSAPGLFFLAMRDTRQLRGLYVVIAVLMVFAFYSLAKTKMPLFMLPIIPFLLGGVAVMGERVWNVIASRRWLAGTALCIAVLYVNDPIDIITQHSSLSELSWYRDQMMRDRERALWLKNYCGSDKWVIFGYPENSRAAFMFYTGQVAYATVPPMETRKEISGKGYRIGVIGSTDSLPEIPMFATRITLPDSLK